MVSHRFAIADPPQKFEEHHQTPNGVTARWVSRNSTFFPLQRAVIFQCTVLSSSVFLLTN